MTSVKLNNLNDCDIHYSVIRTIRNRVNLIFKYLNMF